MGLRANENERVPGLRGESQIGSGRLQTLPRGPRRRESSEARSGRPNRRNQRENSGGAGGSPAAAKSRKGHAMKRLAKNGELLLWHQAGRWLSLGISFLFALSAAYAQGSRKDDIV